MLSILWLWLAAAGPCWATVSPAVDEREPRREDLALDHRPQQSVKLLQLSDNAITSVRVDVAELSARESFTEGQGTVVAVSGNQLQHPPGNLLFVHARDRFGNIRESGDDLFSMDPLMLAALHATQLYIGGGSYQLTYWWETQHSRVAYEVCPRTAGSKSVAQLGQCQSRTYPAGDDRALAYLEVMVAAAIPIGHTSARASSTTCLSATHDSCGRAQAVAGTQASFAIEARTSSGAAHYGESDVFLVTLDGQSHVDAQVSHLRLNYYE